MMVLSKTLRVFILGSAVIQGSTFQLRFGPPSTLLGPNSVIDRLEAYLDDLGSASTLEDQRKKHPAGYMYTFNRDKSITAGRTVLPGGSASYLQNLNGAVATPRVVETTPSYPPQSVASSPPASTNGATQSNEPQSASLVMPNSVTDKLVAYLDNLGSSSTVKDQRTKYSRGFMYTFNKENPTVGKGAVLPGGSSSYLTNLNGAAATGSVTMPAAAVPPPPQNVGSSPAPPTMSSSTQTTQQSVKSPQTSVASPPPPPPPKAVAKSAPGVIPTTQEPDDEELTIKPVSQWTLSEVVLTFLFTLLFAEVMVYFYGTGFFDNLNTIS